MSQQHTSILPLASRATHQAASSATIAEILEVLIRDWQPQLVAYAFGVVKDNDAAYDIWIDVYERSEQQGKMWLLQTNLWGWLRTAVFHASLNYLKRQRRTIPFSMIGDSSWLLKRRTSQFDQPDTGATRKEVTRELEHAVASLSMCIRATVCRHYFDGLTLQEIANNSECSLNTIKSHIRRGKEHLRVKLRAKGIQLTDLGLWATGRYEDFGALLLYDYERAYPATEEEALSARTTFWGRAT